MSHVKRTAEEWKSRNGNITTTNKELLRYIAARVEVIDAKVDGKVSKGTFWGVISILVTIICAVSAIKIIGG